MLAEYLGNAEAWSFSDMDVIQPGEKVFKSFHVSKLTGSAPREVKEIITSIYNSDQDILLENTKPIEKKFDLKYFERNCSKTKGRFQFMVRITWHIATICRKLIVFSASSFYFVDSRREFHAAPASSQIVLVFCVTS